MKKLLVFLLIFQFNSVFGQKTLEQIIDQIPLDENYFSPFGYFDRAGEIQGISIQNEPEILKRLHLEPLEFGEYYLTGKYEINNSILLFISEYKLSEDIHSAILLDKSLDIIDRLDKTAYDNAEGFYGVTSNIDYAIMTTTIHNIYNNPNYVTKKYTITDEGFVAVEDLVLIDSPSGVRVHNEPTANSNDIHFADASEVFNYLSCSSRLDSTSIFQNGKYLKNYWLEVGKEDSFNRFGYIFGAFAKRQIKLTTNDYQVTVNEISKEDFHSEELKKTIQPKIEKITDLDEIKKMLKNQLVGEYHEKVGYFEITKIIADNGKEFSSHMDEYGVSAYFPDHHYLLLEGGHSTQEIINLKNGEDDISKIGNPDYYLSSPKNTFRLNGYYSGQSFEHFLEKTNKNGEPEYLFSFSSLLALDFIESYFWKDDKTIFVKIENAFYSIEMREI